MGRRTPTRGFDTFADEYDSVLNRGLALYGENKDYFARRRISWLSGCLQDLCFECGRVLDFGCGTGATIPLLLDLLGAHDAVGTDPSSRSLDVARSRFGSSRARFVMGHEFKGSGDRDLVFCNGVFHHIVPRERPAALEQIRRSLRPRGLFAFWENNPWNPGTRLLMRRIPFDRDAQTISAGEAKRMLSGHGFELVRTDHLFVFPRPLHRLRRIESGLSQVPIGAQYQVLCRKR